MTIKTDSPFKDGRITLIFEGFDDEAQIKERLKYFLHANLAGQLQDKTFEESRGAYTVRTCTCCSLAGGCATCDCNETDPCP